MTEDDAPADETTLELPDTLEDDVEIVVRNLLNKDHVRSGHVDVVEVGIEDGYTDYYAIVEVGQPTEHSLTVSPWHEIRGFEFEFISSTPITSDADRLEQATDSKPYTFYELALDNNQFKSASLLEDVDSIAFFLKLYH